MLVVNASTARMISMIKCYIGGDHEHLHEDHRMRVATYHGHQREYGKRCAKQYQGRTTLRMSGSKDGQAFVKDDEVNTCP